MASSASPARGGPDNRNQPAGSKLGGRWLGLLTLVDAWMDGLLLAPSRCLARLRGARRTIRSSGRNRGRRTVAVETVLRPTESLRREAGGEVAEWRTAGAAEGEGSGVASLVVAAVRRQLGLGDKKNRGRGGNACRVWRRRESVRMGCPAVLRFGIQFVCGLLPPGCV